MTFPLNPFRWVSAVDQSVGIYSEWVGGGSVGDLIMILTEQDETRGKVYIEPRSEINFNSPAAILALPLTSAPAITNSAMNIFEY